MARSALVLLALAACWALRADSREAWPPFLAAASAAPNEELVRDVWNHATFERVVEAPPLRAPLPIYEAVIDAPDVLAAAATHLQLTTESAEALPDGGFELRGPHGSSAWYRSLSADHRHRVVLSQGTIVVAGIPVNAAVLGDLTISNVDGTIRQQLNAFVRLQNPVLSWATKFLLFVLPALADHELARGFALAQAVSTWADRDPAGFCRWLTTQPPTARTQAISQATDVTACTGAAARLAN